MEQNVTSISQALDDLKKSLNFKEEEFTQLSEIKEAEMSLLVEKCKSIQESLEMANLEKTHLQQNLQIVTQNLEEAHTIYGNKEEEYVKTAQLAFNLQTKGYL